MKGRDAMAKARRRRPAGRDDDTMEAAAARMGIKPAELQELCQRLQAMVSTPEGMTRFLEQTVGPGNYQHDVAENVWVVPDREHRGPGRRFHVVQPDGSWFDAVLPERELS